MNKPDPDTDVTALWTALTRLVSEVECLDNPSPWLVSALEEARLALGRHPYAPLTSAGD